MNSNNINAHCRICGKGYHICNSCTDQKTFKPWRTVTDTINHYKIYMAIHGYTLSKDSKKAKTELECCDLFDIENFIPEIKSVIEEIMKNTKSKVKITNKQIKEKANKNIAVNNDINLNE